ncbi:hypothetical protein Bca101_059829 [Brassica carinata]
MSGDTSNDPFAAYQKAAKSMSAKKGSASRTISGDDLMITGSRQATTVKIEPSALTHTRKTRGGGVATRASYQSAEIARTAGNLAAALSNLNLNVFPHDEHLPALSSWGAVVPREPIGQSRRAGGAEGSTFGGQDPAYSP